MYKPSPLGEHWAEPFRKLLVLYSDTNTGSIPGCRAPPWVINESLPSNLSPEEPLQIMVGLWPKNGDFSTNQRVQVVPFACIRLLKVNIHEGLILC